MGKLDLEASAGNTVLDPTEFKDSMLSMRKLFAAKGIKSKADAYQLINQGFSEKRFSEADLRGLQHATDMVFDPDGFKTAQTLMSAKEKGLKLAAAKRAVKSTPAVAVKDNVRAKNKMKFAKAGK